LKINAQKEEEISRLKAFSSKLEKDLQEKGEEFQGTFNELLKYKDVEDESQNQKRQLIEDNEKPDNDLKEKLVSVTEELERVKLELKAKEEELEETVSTVIAKQDEDDKTQNELRELAEEKDKEINELEDQLKEIETQKNAEIEELREQVVALEDELKEQTNAEIDELREQIIAHENLKSDLEAKIATFSQKDLSDAQKKVKELSNSGNKAKNDLKCALILQISATGILFVLVVGLLLKAKFIPQFNILKKVLNFPTNAFKKMHLVGGLFPPHFKAYFLA